MNEKVKAEWLDALESGRYKKGKGALRTDDRFCCLGVLCEIAQKHGVVGREVILISKPSNIPWYGYYAHEDTNHYLERMYLPPAVSEWAELEDHNPTAGLYRLSVINDKNDTFEPVIKLIREYL